jgi:ABC-2 type transport system ATP-binding protein
LNELLVAQNLHKSFGGVQAVSGVDLALSPGEIYGLVGPDGAGKTTTIRLLCGVLRPDAGEVHINGTSLLRDPERARADLGYLSQRFSLYDDLTVLENLRFFAEVRGLLGVQWQARAQEILEFVGLDPFQDRRAGHLSGGMKQKLGLATALVHHPRLLLLDEPTGGVDPVTRQDFWQLILRLVTGDGVAVLVSTPYMDEASRCTKVGFMRAGRLVISGSPGALRDRLKDRVMELRGKPLAKLRRLVAEDPDVETVQSFGDRLHLRVRSGTIQKVQKRLTKRLKDVGAPGFKLRPVKPQLEDVFIETLEREVHHG